MGGNVFLKIFLDVIVLLCVAAPLLGFFWVEPFHRGFFYNDETIRLPYGDQSIPTYLITPLVIAIPIVLILLTEIIHRNSDKNADDRILGGKLISGWIWECYRGMGAFLFGLATQQLISTIAKYALGRLRPHFIYVCNPQFQQPEPPPIYILADAYTCGPGTDERVIKEARLSFPSAHASSSMYAAVFLMLYFHHYWRWQGSKLFRHACQLLVMLCAWYVGITRIQDYMHHWDDVAAGFLLGAIVAVLVFIYVLKPKRLWKYPQMTFQEAIDHQRDLEMAHHVSAPERHLPRAALGNGGASVPYT